MSNRRQRMVGGVSGTFRTGACPGPKAGVCAGAWAVRHTAWPITKKS